MVFNATFNNISVISWRSALFVEEIGGHGENHLSVCKYVWKPTNMLEYISTK